MKTNLIRQPNDENDEEEGVDKNGEGGRWKADGQVRADRCLGRKLLGNHFWSIWERQGDNAAFECAHEVRAHSRVTFKMRSTHADHDLWFTSLLMNKNHLNTLKDLFVRVGIWRWKTVAYSDRVDWLHDEISQQPIQIDSHEVAVISNFDFWL